MALGFRNAGISSDLLVEIDKDSCKTLEMNFNNTNIVCDDIKNVDFKNTKTKLILLLEDSPAKHSHMLERVRVSKTREDSFL